MNIITLTELKVGVVWTDVVAGAEQPLHHQSSAHRIIQAEVLWDTTLLKHTHTRSMCLYYTVQSTV